MLKQKHQIGSQLMIQRLTPFKFHFLVCCILILPDSEHTLAETHTTCLYYCRQGDKAVTAGVYDSAFHYYAQAYNAGLSRDSLKYFWANVYLARYVLDTALALNYAIKQEHGSAFHYAVLKQRYFIYTALQWQDKAECVLDSLKRQSSYRKTLFIPRLEFSSEVGYTDRKELLTGTFPWNEFIGVDTTDIEHGIFYNAGGQLNWTFALKRKKSLSLSIGCGASKPYYIQDAVADSLKINSQVFFEARLENLWGYGGIGMQAGGKRDYLGTLTSTGQMDVNYTKVTTRWLNMIALGYSLEVLDDASVNNQSLWLIGCSDRSYKSQRGPAFTLLANMYLAKSIRQEWDDYTNLYYVDDTKADFVTHYTDASYTSPVASAGSLSGIISLVNYVTELKKTYYDFVPLSVLYGRNFFNTIPQKYVHLSPSTSYTFGLPAKIRMKAGIGWSFSYFPDNFEWVSVNREEASTYGAYGTWLAFERSTGYYYILREEIKNDINNGFAVIEEYSDIPATFTSEYHSQRRIDNAFVGNLSLERDCRFVGTITVDAGLRRTWSTLDDNCPVDVPEFSWSAQIQWSKTIAAKNRFR